MADQDVPAFPLAHAVGSHQLVDFWSLGVLLFEMCCGWSPFYAEDTQQMYKNICFGKIKFPRVSSNSDAVVRDRHPDSFSCLRRAGCYWRRWQAICQGCKFCLSSPARWE